MSGATPKPIGHHRLVAGAVVVAALLVGSSCVRTNDAVTTAPTVTITSPPRTTATTTATTATTGPDATGAVEDDSQKAPPTRIVIVNPPQGASYEAGWRVDVAARIEPRHATLHATLLVDGEVVDSGDYPELAWESAGPGDHQLQVTAQVEDAGTIESEPTLIHVSAPPPPPTEPPPPEPPATQPPPPLVLPYGAFYARTTEPVKLRETPFPDGRTIAVLGTGTLVAVRCFLYGGNYETGRGELIGWADVVTTSGTGFIADYYLDTPKDADGEPGYTFCNYGK